MQERILTQHPNPTKRGVRIDKEKYEQIRTAILQVLREKSPLTFTQLSQAVEAQLGGLFQGSISWYVVSVKLDLEARGVIERIQGKQHRVRLKE